MTRPTRGAMPGPVTILLGVFVLLLVGLWFGRAPLTQAGLSQLLKAQGFTQAQFTVERVDLGGIILRDLDLGPGQPRVARAEVTYRPLRLWAGRPDRVRIVGLRHHLSSGASQTDGGALDGPASPADPLPAPSVPSSGPSVGALFDPLASALKTFMDLGAGFEIEDAVVTLDSGAGPASGLSTGQAGEPGVPLALALDGQFGFNEEAAPVALALTVQRGDPDADELPAEPLIAYRASGEAGPERMVLSGPLQIRIDALDLPGERTLRAVRYGGDLAVVLDAGEDKADLTLEPGLVGRLTSRPLSAPSGPQPARGPDSGEEKLFGALQLGAVALGLDNSPDAPFRAVLALVAERFDLPAIGLNGQSVDIQGRVTREGDALVDRLAGVFVQTGEAPVMGPLHLDLSGRMEEGRLELAGHVAPRPPSVSGPLGNAAESGLPAALTYDFGLRGVRFALGPGQLDFAPRRLQPAALSPYLAGFTQAQGGLTIDADVLVAPGAGGTSRVALGFNGLSVGLPLGAAGGRVEGLDGAVTLSGLPDFVTPPSQRLTARRITGPATLKAPTLAFALRRIGQTTAITLEEARAGFADGTLRVEPATFVVGAETNRLALDLESLDLALLLEEWGGGRVSGEGRLSGTVPVFSTPQGVVIEDGRLAADGPGVIRVTWGDTREALIGQGQQVSLMVRALEDFRYERLEIGVTRPQGGELALAVTLAGNNPAVLDGQAFVFNVTLTGDLERLIAALGSGSGLTTDLLRGQLGTAN